MTYDRVGYRCIQGYPNRICCGCTSGCCEPVFVVSEDEAVTKTGRVLTDDDFERLASEAASNWASVRPSEWSEAQRRHVHNIVHGGC